MVYKLLIILTKFTALQKNVPFDTLEQEVDRKKIKIFAIK